MAKATPKKKSTKKARGEYDKPLAVKGSFMDIMKASVKDADNGNAAKRKTKKD